MNTTITKLLVALTGLGLGFAVMAQGQPSPEPAQPEAAQVQAPENAAQPSVAELARQLMRQNAGETNAETAAEQQQIMGELLQQLINARQGTNGETSAGNEAGKAGETPGALPIRGQGPRGTAGSSTNAEPLASLIAKTSTNQATNGEKSLRLNFRNAPLSMVLDYLSDAAGFIISANSKVDLKGTVTVWSNQPVDRNEAIQILQKALSDHNYAATVEGNVLNIYVLDASNSEIIAGIPGNNYENIPATKELVTQIVYVHNVEAGQLIQTLQPLMPPGTSMSANQGANAIVITDSKANIRRMAQLVKALDTASVSASTVRVFPLKYADATALAQVVQQLFQGTDANGGQPGGRFAAFFSRFGRGGRGQPSNSNTTPAGRMAEAQVVATADDRSNSLIVSASQDQMELIADLVSKVDVNVDDVTELRVFRLNNADPEEIADQLSNLFPDPTTQQTSGSRQSRGRGFFARFAAANNRSTDPNSHTVRETRVTAVPDPRTESVIVSASHDLMGQIADIIHSLDSDPAKKKKVYVIKVENRDPQELVQDLQSVIAADTSGGNFSAARSSSFQSGSQLSTRQQNNLRNQGNNNSSFGSGFGNSRTRTGR